MKIFYHGSAVGIEPGVVLRPRGEAYVADWGATDFHDALERWRPEGKLAHRDAVFMVGDVDDIDLAGGATDWCLEVTPVGEVTRHDLNWSSAISCLVGDGYAVDSPEVRAAAESYWRGDPHPDESVWEFMAAGAVVVRCEPYETFSPTP